MSNDSTKVLSSDLEERTARFGERVVAFARRIKADAITKPLISQLARSATSIGANYIEANDADTRKDFKYRIGIARREAKETKHWIRMIVVALPDLKEAARPLWQGAHELNLIFGKIRQQLK